MALAELSYRLDGDDSNAEREFVRAMELDGQNAYVRQRYAAFLKEHPLVARFDIAPTNQGGGGVTVVELKD